MRSLLALNDQLEAFGAALENFELKLVVQIKGCTEAIKSGPEIGSRSGDIHHHGGANLRFSHRCALGGSARY